jgi:hypothetical protein
LGVWPEKGDEELDRLVVEAEKCEAMGAANG